VLRAQGGRLAFRHTITLRAIESVLSPVRSVALNRRALELLRRHPRWRRDHSRLAHHAERAGDAGEVLRCAVAAAAEDSALGAHRQAARQYERALRFADGLSVAKRADLLEREAREFSLSGMATDAVQAQTAASELWRALHDARREGASLRWLSQFLWHCGRADDAQTRGRDSLRILESVPAGAELAWACATLAQVTMLDVDKTESIGFGMRAVELSERFGATDARAAAWISVGTSRLDSGDERGFDDLERGLGIAREAGDDEVVARAWFNLVGGAIQFFRLRSAEHWVSEGLSWCAGRDLLGWEHDLRWLRSAVRCAQGDYEGAEADADAVIRSTINPLTRLNASIQQSWVHARRGEEVTATLDSLLEDVEQSSGVWRDSLVAILRAVRAEAALSQGDLPLALDEARDGYVLARRLGFHEIAGTLALSIRRAGGSPPDIGSQPEPVRLQMSGDWRAAATRWRELGYPLETARALMEGDEAAVREAWEIFDRLGAFPDARAAAAKLRVMGSVRIPRGRRATTRSNPGGLTAREVEVLVLIAEGKSDREIANQLFLSSRTVSHHVSSILGKLQVPDRTAAADAATRMGLVQIRQRAGAM
jgi:DNA-binding CsgD family transcriptional regulator